MDEILGEKQIAFHKFYYKIDMNFAEYRFFLLRCTLTGRFNRIS